LGETNFFKIALLIGLLSGTSLTIYWPHSIVPIRENYLNEIHLESLGEWKAKVKIPLDQKIIKALELDDYVNILFFRNGHEISLYIGYYNSLKKIGAAHSPLVCIPGQGWSITNTEKASFKIDGNSINTHSILAEMGESEILIVYWYQAFNKVFSGTLMQKMYAFFAKYMYGNEKNAFIRVSLTTKSESTENEIELINDFLNHFYPRFIKFMRK
jgi:EpsI family protein